MATAEFTVPGSSQRFRVQDDGSIQFQDSTGWVTFQPGVADPKVLAAASAARGNAPTATTTTPRDPRQAVVEGIRPGWTIYGERQETKEVNAVDQYGEVTGKKQEPTGNVVLLIKGPNGQVDEMTVKESSPGSPGTPAGGGGSTDAPSPARAATPATYTIVQGPAKPLKGGADDPQGQTQANDPKGHIISKPQSMPDGSTAMVDYIADGLGNYSVDESHPPRTYIPAKADNPAPTISTTAKKIPQKNKDGVWEWVDNPAYVEPVTPRPAPRTPEQIRADAAAATVGEAQAGTAGETAAAALTTAQANAQLAEANLVDAQRRARQAPTDEQAQAAIATAQKALELANTGLEQAQAQAKALAPGAVAQQGATLQATQEGIKKGQQGDLYGLEDKIKQIRDLIALGPDNGGIKPQDGDQMIAAARQGTSVYDVMKQQAAEKSAARGQDISSKNQMASTFGSTFNNSLNTFGEMNKTGAIGSDATGKAFLATLGLAQDYLKSYEPSAVTPTDYLGTGSPVGQMANMAQQIAAPAPPPAPVVPPPAPVIPGGATPITINIGSGAASNPQPQVAPDPRFAGGGLGPVANAPAPVIAGQQADNGIAMADHVGGLVGAAARATPAGIGDIAAAFPGAAKRHGLQW